jgi:D-amino-acid dehydrogenase
VTASAPAQGRQSIAVIGAGIVGTACALMLQREFGSVTSIDTLPPAGGASFGNSGLIAVDSCGPMATPGMLRQVPGWLMDRNGPLSVDPGYFLRALPWLIGRIRSGGMAKIIAASDAFRSLHQSALGIYRELLGPAHFSDLIRIAGHLEVWEGEQESEGQKIGRQLRKRHGIQSDRIGPEQIRQFVPEISPTIRQAEFVANGAHTVNPQRLTRTLSDLFREEGGVLVQERVTRIVPEESGGFRILTNIGDRRFDKVLVAAGAWSARLLAPLGIRLPLESERGYHVMVKGSDLDLKIPILHRSRGFGVVPMEHGLRFAGTVEIAGLDAPPNVQRAEIIRRQAERLFPSLKTTDSTIWMGHRPSFPDNLPVLDSAARFRNLYIACGHGHLGITSAPASARLMTEMMGGRRGEIDPAPFRASRFG